MASNRLGEILALTTFGESHGPGIGGVIDGFPAGFPVDFEAVQRAMEERAPGRTPWTSPRKESDQVEWLSGLLDGRTTGAPIAFWIKNQDVKRESYQTLQSVYRPGHATWSYLAKYRVFDAAGGGRASARETAVRVVAGALAEQWLAGLGVVCGAYLDQVGTLQGARAMPAGAEEARAWREQIGASALYAQDEGFCSQAIALLERVMEEGDSLGGVVAAWAVGVPAGWGDPMYQKLEAQLAHAMMSLPASKGFEMGEGFQAASMRGSQHNDAFVPGKGGGVAWESNHAGGVLAGISTGEPLFCRTAFKPASSIRIPTPTCTLSGEATSIGVPPGSRHDPCVAIRAVPVVRSLLAWTLMEAALRQRLVPHRVAEERSAMQESLS
ncbi:MAG: chorismate synthase [Chlamydiia bacterium]